MSVFAVGYRPEYKLTRVQNCPRAYGHLKISWTLTAEKEIAKISRDHLIRINVQYFISPWLTVEVVPGRLMFPLNTLSLHMHNLNG